MSVEKCHMNAQRAYHMDMGKDVIITRQEGALNNWSCALHCTWRLKACKYANLEHTDISLISELMLFILS